MFAFWLPGTVFRGEEQNRYEVASCFFCFQLCLDHTLDNFAFGENFAALTLKVDLPPPFPPLNVTDVKRGTNKCVDGFLPCLVQEQPCISTLRHHLSPIPLSNTSRTWRAIRGVCKWCLWSPEPLTAIIYHKIRKYPTINAYYPIIYYPVISAYLRLTVLR